MSVLLESIMVFGLLPFTLAATGSAQRHDSSYEGLEELVKAYVQDNTILLAFTNWGDTMTLFPDNLVHTMKNVGRTNYLLIATDNKAYNYLRCRGFHAFNDAPSFSGTKLTEKVSGYEDDLQGAYHVLALGRFHIVSEVLKMGVHVIFSDTDVVMIHDPIPMFLKATNDVLFLWDGANTADGKTHLLGRGTAGAVGEIQSNAGFFFARNTPNTLAWFAHVRVMMDAEAKLRAQGRGRHNDQQIIGFSLEKKELAKAKSELDWKLLPRDALINGWLIKNEYKDRPQGLGCLATGPNAMKHTLGWMVIHMNYNKGAKRKVTHFKRCGLWECEFCINPAANTCMKAQDDWETWGFNKDDF